MRGFGVAACAAMCGGLVLAAPARADQYDLISQLDNSGVSYESIIDMIDIGKEVCHDLRGGAPPPVVLGRLANTGFVPAESAIILVAAVNNMCLDTKADVAAWARGNGFTGPV
jgi:hypothetical protein